MCAVGAGQGGLCSHPFCEWGPGTMLTIGCCQVLAGPTYPVQPFYIIKGQTVWSRYVAELFVKMQSKRPNLQISLWTNLWTGPGQSKASPCSPQCPHKVTFGVLPPPTFQPGSHLKPQMAKHFRSGDVSFRVYEARFMKSFSV